MLEKSYEDSINNSIDRKVVMSNRLKSSNTLQITLDEDFNVSDSKQDIEVVVKKCGGVRIDSVNVDKAKAEVMGCLEFSMLYTGFSQQKEKMLPVKMAGEIKFNEKVNLSEPGENGDVTALARLEDLTIKIINSRKINVKAIVEIIVENHVCESSKIATFVDNDSDLNLQVKKEPVNFLDLSVNLVDNLRIKETISLPQDKPNIGNIFWEQVEIGELNYRMSDEGIDINGQIQTFFMYEPLEVGNKIQYIDMTVPFEGNLQISGCSADMVPFLKYEVLSATLEAKPNYDGETRDIGMEMVLKMDIKAYKEQQENLLGDMYSPVKELELEENQVNLRKLVQKCSNICKASQRVKVKEYSQIEEIISCSGNAVIDDTFVDETGILINGAVLADVMYLDKNEEKYMGCFTVTVPFSHRVPMKDCENVNFDVNVSGANLKCILVGNEEVEVRASVNLEIICMEEYSVGSIGNVQVSPRETMNCGGNYNPNGSCMPGIVGYIADGRDTLWDVAKRYNTTMDIIIGNNDCMKDYESMKNPYKDCIRKGEKLLVLRA